MSAFKGTPGPWELMNGCNVFSQLGADSGDGYKAPDNDGWLIATVEIGAVSDENGELVEMGRSCVAANARLITAAPDLLEALADWYREHTGLPPTAANAAIAKALGEDQP